MYGLEFGILNGSDEGADFLTSFSSLINLAEEEEEDDE